MRWCAWASIPTSSSARIRWRASSSAGCSATSSWTSSPATRTPSSRRAARSSTRRRRSIWRTRWARSSSARPRRRPAAARTPAAGRRLPRRARKAAMPRRRSNTAVPGERVVEQRWDPGRYRENAGFVAVLGEPLLDLLAPKPGERILDLGCGDGALTRKIAAVARVVAVDASADQVQAARARGLDAHVMDGTRLGFEREFDAVFSNAALHWMRDPDAVIDGVWRALKPGGRFVAECGGAGNVAAVREALCRAVARRGVDGHAVSPWYFPSVDEYQGRLE